MFLRCKKSYNVLKNFKSKPLNQAKILRGTMSDFTKILITSENLGQVEAEIIDKNHKTSEAMMKALPFEGAANVWGDEVGPTPASENEKPKAYSPVNLFARVIGDPKVFGKVKNKEIIQVIKAEY
jgi:hypothetical protein